MHKHIRLATPVALLIVTLLTVSGTNSVIAQSEVIEIRALKDQHPEITSLSTRITIRMKGRVGANNRAQNVNGQVVASYVIDNERGEKSLEFGGSLFGQLMGLGAGRPHQNASVEQRAVDEEAILGVWKLKRPIQMNGRWNRRWVA